MDMKQDLFYVPCLFMEVPMPASHREPRKRRVMQKTTGRTVTYFVVSYTDETGRRRQPHFRTRREAVAHRNLVDERKTRGLAADEPVPGSIEELCEDWLEACETGTRIATTSDVVRKGVVADRRARLKRHVYPVFGGRDVELITPRDVLKAYIGRSRGRDHVQSGGTSHDGEDGGPGRREVQLAYQHLRAALVEGAVNGVVPNHGWASMKLNRVDPQRHERPPERSPEDALPDAETLRRLLDVARRLRDEPEEALREAGMLSLRRDGGPDLRAAAPLAAAWRLYYPMIVLGVYAGVRLSEIRAARRYGVDIDGGAFFVTGSADKDGNTSAPKTEAGEREIPLPQEAVEALKDRLEDVDERPDALLFSRLEPRAMPITQFYKYGWNRLFEVAGVPRFNFHKLRSFYASWHVDRGTSPHRLRRYMGHASIRTTLDIYVKQLGKSEDEILELFAESPGEQSLTVALGSGPAG